MNPRVVVLYGGCSSERDVSLRSGKAVAEALQREGFEPHCVDLKEEALPDGLDPERDVIFPVLHGGFGEGGPLQELLEQDGFRFCGCDARSSRLCMDKAATKASASAVGVPVAKGTVLEPGEPADSGTIVAKFGPELVLKPASEGSSVGLAFVSGGPELAAWLKKPREGAWLVEQRLQGRELTCGVLDGHSMGVVEIVPKSGVYDYGSKYTSGSTEYRFPAEIGPEATSRVQGYSEAAFKACGCRDFARADFILLPSGESFLLELNTIPGMTETSLLPKSASCIGLSFDALVRRMIESALRRFNPQGC